MIVFWRCNACGFIVRRDGTKAARLWTENQAGAPHAQPWTAEALADLKHPLNGRGAKKQPPDAKCNYPFGQIWRTEAA